MEIKNLKIYSGGLYSWNLSTRICPSEDKLYSYPSSQIPNLIAYSDQYFLTENRVDDQIFVIGLGDSIVGEVLTGTKIVVDSSLNSSKYPLADIANILPYCVKLNDLSEEINVTKIKNYIEKVKPQEIIEKLNIINNNFANIVSFYNRQQSYVEQHSQKINELVKQIQRTWKK